MWITLPEAVSIYARFFLAQYGAAASQRARTTAAQLKKRGDLQGHQVWSDVAREIEHMTEIPGGSFDDRSRPKRQSQIQSRGLLQS